ncbi:MAG: hypothetical protein GKR90_20270 [Pseudomonadales bacterium]|nr:hypothetical protein [Pseudomonadales bacterium]
MDVRIATLQQINDLPWGTSSSDLESVLGLADQILENYTGEVEMLYGDSFYRFFNDRLVEATFPDVYQFHVDGMPVLSMFEWLAGCKDVVDMAKFRISLAHGIAYDYRVSSQGSITVFEAGRWDALVLNNVEKF